MASTLKEKLMAKLQRNKERILQIKKTHDILQEKIKTKNLKNDNLLCKIELIGKNDNNNYKNISQSMEQGVDTDSDDVN